MSSRQRILDRIRQALADGCPAPTIPRDYRGAGTTATSDLVALLEERLLDYGAVVRHCSQETIAPTISAALATQGAQRVIAPEGLPSGWLLDAQADQPELSTDELDRLDGVVTSCAVAIAQTGTIVLDHSAGQGRRALTLIPDYHLVIVREDQIVRAVPDAIATLDARRPMTWISGPSATSDIELSRVEGVHGPRRLEVIIAARSTT